MRYCYITIPKESCVLGWGCPYGIFPHKLDWPWGLCWLMRHQQVWSKHKFDKHFCFDTVTLGAWFPRKKSVPSCWRGDVQENQGMAAQTDLQLCDWGRWETVSSQPSCCLEAERLMSPATSPTHGKAIGDSFCMDQNSKTRIAGQLGGEEWTFLRPHISHSQSQETSLTTRAQKGSLEIKEGGDVKGCSTHTSVW